MQTSAKTQDSWSSLFKIIVQFQNTIISCVCLIELLTKTRKNASVFKVLIFKIKFSQTEHIEVQHKHTFKIKNNPNLHLFHLCDIALNFDLVFLLSVSIY